MISYCSHINSPEKRNSTRGQYGLPELEEFARNDWVERIIIRDSSTIRPEYNALGRNDPKYRGTTDDGLAIRGIIREENKHKKQSCKLGPFRLTSGTITELA